jgi:hypothetical protein
VKGAGRGGRRWWRAREHAAEGATVSEVVCRGLVVVAVSGELKLLGHSWRCFWMKIHFQADSVAPTSCSPSRCRLGEVCFRL